MNLGLAAATFAVVIPAELPDKTFVSTVVLSSRHRPLPVWSGAAAGLVAQAGVAAVAGRLLALAPHRVVAAIVAGLFVAGAAYLFSARGSAVERRSGEIASDEERRLAPGDGDEPPRTGRHGLSRWRIAAVTFLVIALAEFGDLTQVVIANLSAKSRDPLSVFCGAALAFVVISGVGVAAGRTITRAVPLDVVRKLSGVILLGLGVWSAVAAATA
ncbi:MAG: TMEM165/GDT1 family protein [Acidimicrobiales bacterium]